MLLHILFYHKKRILSSGFYCTFSQKKQEDFVIFNIMEILIKWFSPAGGGGKPDKTILKRKIMI